MEDHKMKAFDVALDLVKQLITLATGTLALSATFLKDILGLKDGSHIPHTILLFFTWGSLLLSILSGLFAHGAITGTLDRIDVTKPLEITIYKPNITFWTIMQCLIFYAGIVLLVLYILLATP